MPFTPSVFKRIAYYFILLLFATSCDRGIFESGLDEGVIEYRIEYPDLGDDHVMMDLLPKKMEMTFKEGEYRNEISAGMGLFKTSIIKEKENEKLIHTIKLLNKKLASELNAQDIKRMNKAFNDIEFKKTNGTKEIAGYQCQEVQATVKGDSIWEFKLYYTDEIDVPNSNYLNPFAEIEGVLMQYEMINNDLHMLFIAENVLKKDINREDILLAEEYEMVSPENLEKELEAIFEKVK
jgi:hypothetical protein